jgi:prolyl-tRNA synthetase
VPGDREVDMKRLEAQVGPAEIAPFGDDDFAANKHLVKGYIGPSALGADKPAGIRYLLDPRIVDGTQWVTGADQPGRHVLYLTAGRDFVADGTVEAAEVVDGDACPVCQSPMEIARGIEIGHIFQLGRKYANALGLTVLDQNGKQQVVTMGSYGIGVSRAVAAIAEMNCDDKGLIWPAEVAPADVHIVATGKPGDPQFPAAERLAEDCEAAGLRVLFDDRVGVSPGIKFNDAELIGVPTIIIVGRGLVDGVVEVRDRRSGDRRDVTIDKAVSELRTSIR